MTSQLRCDGCSVRFGRRARPLLLFSTFVLCPQCAESTTIHRDLFRGCLQHHSCAAHGGDHVTTGRAREALTPTTERR
jgi:hypothetical protein